MALKLLQMAVTDNTDSSRSGVFKPAPPTSEEHKNVQLLIGMMGCHYDTALRVLRRSGGDIEKAAAALLEENDAAGKVALASLPRGI